MSQLITRDYFFVIGAQRSGTTYLYHLLDSHPEIEMAKPVKPEPKFFLLDDVYAEGFEAYEQTFYDAQSDAKVRGEKSTSYIEYEKVAERMMATLPPAKVVCIVRDPIERAISNYWFTHNFGIEPLSMADAFRQEEGRWQDYDHEKISASPYAYVRRGHYMTYLDAYLRHVPREQMYITIHEKLLADSDEARRLFDFLGVSPDHQPPMREDKVNASKKADDSLPDALRAELKQHYAPSIARLSEFLDDDLRQWWATARI
jgi:hypothetical protein